MIELELKREVRTETYTLGHLYINSRYFCDTIEDAVRILNEYEDKIYGKTAIPYGRYRVVLTYSSHFKCVMPELLNVDFFRGIRIHWGNTAADSEGCTGLTNAPDIIARTLHSNHFKRMFYGCTNLNYIKCLSVSGSSSDWLTNVASNGLCIKSVSLNRSNLGLPSSWTVQDA